MTPITPLPGGAVNMQPGAYYNPNAGQSGIDPAHLVSPNGLPGPDDPRWHLALVAGEMMGDSVLKQAAEQPSSPQLPDFNTDTTQPGPTYGLDQAKHDATTTPTGAPAPKQSPSGSGSSVIQDANKYLGIKYVYGGTDPKTGLDCSGFVQRVFADMGVNLPRVTYDQVKVGTLITDQKALAPGDLIFMWGDGNRQNGHVGIYVGNGIMVNAPHTGANVRYDSVPWDRVTAMRRVL